MRDRSDKPTSEEDRLFAEAMRQLGVLEDPALDADDAAIFQAAMDSEDLVVPEKNETREQASPSVTHGTDRSLKRRIRQEQVMAEATMDLHGLRREDAERKLARFLARKRRDGAQVVKIICGRGLHSRDHAVLRDLVPKWLDGALAHHSRQWVRAPRNQGGEGAIYVFLRPNRSP